MRPGRKRPGFFASVRLHSSVMRCPLPGQRCSQPPSPRFFCCVRSAPRAVDEFYGFCKGRGKTFGSFSALGSTLVLERIISEQQHFITFRQTQGPQQAWRRFDLRQRHSMGRCDGMQGALDLLVRHKGEEAEPVLGRVDRVESRLHFLEYIIVALAGPQVGAEGRCLGQQVDDPGELSFCNTDLMVRAAADLSG